jgi:hypothetical protein
LAYHPLNKKKETSRKFSKVGKDGRKKGGFLVAISHFGLSVGNTQERCIGFVFEIRAWTGFEASLTLALGLASLSLAICRANLREKPTWEIAVG